MSDITNNVNDGFSSQVLFMLGRLESKVDGLVAAMSRMENEHANLVATNAREHAALRDATLSGDASLAMRIETMRTDLTGRINSVEDAAAIVRTSYNTLRTASVALTAVIAGIFAVIQWVVPLVTHLH